MYIIFFFKQKTAYEMRISDWSSDVCSSDLTPTRRRSSNRAHRARSSLAPRSPRGWALARGRKSGARRPKRRSTTSPRCSKVRICASSRPAWAAARAQGRSEEHTSELQSLMRTSYAVFCLKKKNQPTQDEHQEHT